MGLTISYLLGATVNSYANVTCKETYMGFLNRQLWGRGGGGGMRAPHHNFVVIALMIVKFGTAVKLDVFYTTVTKNCDVTTIRHFDVMTCILADE